MRAPLLLLVFAGFPPALVHAQGLPPVDSPEQAAQQLSLERPDAQPSALANLKAACKGRLRHSLKDHTGVVELVERRIRGGQGEVPRLALDTVRCFSASHAQRLLAAGLESSRLEVATYAAEMAAQVAEPPVTELLLAELERHRPACADAAAAKDVVERCVWLVYSAGASVGAAHDRALRERLGRTVEPELESPHPKVREVAVESLAKTRLAAHAPAILRLLEKERKGGFSEKNDAALLPRFQERAKTLKSRGD